VREKPHFIRKFLHFMKKLPVSKKPILSYRTLVSLFIFFVCLISSNTSLLCNSALWYTSPNSWNSCPSFQFESFLHFFSFYLWCFFIQNPLDYFFSYLLSMKLLIWYGFPHSAIYWWKVCENYRKPYWCFPFFHFF